MYVWVIERQKDNHWIPFAIWPEAEEKEARDYYDYWWSMYDEFRFVRGDYNGQCITDVWIVHHYGSIIAAYRTQESAEKYLNTKGYKNKDSKKCSKNKSLWNLHTGLIAHLDKIRLKQ